MRFPQRRLTLGLRRTLAQVLLRSFRPVFLTRRRTAAPRSWMSRLGSCLGSTPPSRDQNMAPASSGVSILSSTPRLSRRLRFTVELMPSRPMVAWRSLTLVSHIPSSNATYLISMLSVGAVSVACGLKCALHFWSGFGESAPLQTWTSVRLSVHLFRADELTCSLAVRACVVPPSVMQHAVLLGRDCWMRFNNCSYRSLPPRTIGVLASSRYLTTPRQACGLTP